MIKQLPYTVPLELLDLADEYFFNDFKVSLNYPTGRFFYDQWIIKDEFKDSIWETILKTLPINFIGEARLIALKPNTCYQSHADIDDRYHLTIRGNYSYLIDLDRKNMYPSEKSGIWYLMDASPRHSAVNFGVQDRLQLVVRKLLPVNTLQSPTTIKLQSKLKDLDDTRFLFDDTMSQWLNRSVKKGIINNFNQENGKVMFDIEASFLEDLNSIMPKEFYYD